ncbi:MAG: M23 family metallopeptidase [Flavobacteriaceae bacterium]
MRILFLFLILSLVSSVTKAQNIKDRPLTTSDDLIISWVNNKQGASMQIRNKLYCPIQVYFRKRANDSIISTFIIPSKDSLSLVSFKDKKNQNNFIKQTKVSYYWGDPQEIDPDLNYKYQLPFKKGKRYEVSQSFNGKSSHRSITGKYAVDFVMPVGTPVHAAREGQVIKVIDWFTKHGGEAYVNAANKIIILHSDGSMASYVHLDYQGASVQEGQWVSKGEPIGFSGLTGKTSGPHLHFVVRRDNDIAIPIYFKGYPNQILKPGKRYKSK